MTNFLSNTPDAERLEQFAANVAHDFNNLLTGILGNLELMQSRAARGGVTQFDSYLDGARNAGGRAAIFAQRLLAFSGRAGQEFSTHDAHALIREAVAQLRAQGHAIGYKPPATPAALWCDPVQAVLALHELLTNAIEATPPTGAITVQTEVASKTIRITIQDTGAGMAPEVLARALEPFFSTRPNGAGKGLGLAIAERFARQAGGTLHLASTPGQGTRVTLLLPERTD